MRDLVKLTDEQIEEKFEELGTGTTIDDIIWTRDTIDDFLIAAEKDYREYKSIWRGEDAAMIERAQARKGDPRRDVYIVDFGEVRGVCIY